MNAPERRSDPEHWIKGMEPAATRQEWIARVVSVVLLCGVAAIIGRALSWW